MSITKHIILRHRSSGHLRFEVPAALLEGESGDQTEYALRHHPGIYRVQLFRRQNKISIRYFEGLADLISVARVLADTAVRLEQQIRADPIDSGTELVNRAYPPNSDWLRSAVQETKETLTAAGIVFQRFFKSAGTLPGESSKYAVDFFTDLLVLWLVRSHWHLITQHWLKRPWTYRYEWSASLYMIFLLVRSRKSKG